MKSKLFNPVKAAGYKMYNRKNNYGIMSSMNNLKSKSYFNTVLPVRTKKKRVTDMVPQLDAMNLMDQYKFEVSDVAD